MREIVMSARLLREFTVEAQRVWPRKVFGYFVATRPQGPPKEFLILRENVRDEWASEFAAYGRYFHDHGDAGFVGSPAETYRVERYIREQGLRKVGVFHSHSRHPGILTSVDADFHPSGDLWHLLVVLRNPCYPQLRAFEVQHGKRIRELPIRTRADEDS